MNNTIDNPVTGERIKFREHPAEIDLLAMEFTVAPRGFAAAPHVHRRQEERFHIETGTITFRIGGREVTARAGESVAVPPGTPHVWRNPSDHDAARMVIEFRPALRMESYLRQWFGLACDGKVNVHGMPNLLQLAVVMREYDQEIRPPHPVQRALLAPLAVVGRLLGYRGRYSRYEDPGQDSSVIPSR